MDSGFVFNGIFLPGLPLGGLLPSVKALYISSGYWSMGLGLGGCVAMIWLFSKKWRLHSWASWFGSEISIVKGHALPPYVRMFFNSRRPELATLGFTFVGDCQTVQEGKRIYCRYYSRLTGEIYAELSAVKISSDAPTGSRVVQSVTLATVFENGKTLVTCDPGLGERKEDGANSSRIIYHCRPHLPLQELLQDHQRAMETYSAEQQTTACRYPPAQVVEAGMRYADSYIATGIVQRDVCGLMVQEPDATCPCPLAKIQPLAYMPG